MKPDGEAVGGVGPGQRRWRLADQGSRDEGEGAGRLAAQEEGEELGTGGVELIEIVDDQREGSIDGELLDEIGGTTPQHGLLDLSRGRDRLVAGLDPRSGESVGEGLEGRTKLGECSENALVGEGGRAAGGETEIGAVVEQCLGDLGQELALARRPVALDGEVARGGGGTQPLDGVVELALTADDARRRQLGQLLGEIAFVVGDGVDRGRRSVSSGQGVGERVERSAGGITEFVADDRGVVFDRRQGPGDLAGVGVGGCRQHGEVFVEGVGLGRGSHDVSHGDRQWFATLDHQRVEDPTPGRHDPVGGLGDAIGRFDVFVGRRRLEQPDQIVGPFRRSARGEEEPGVDEGRGQVESADAAPSRKLGRSQGGAQAGQVIAQGGRPGGGQRGPEFVGEGVERDAARSGGDEGGEELSLDARQRLMAAVWPIDRDRSQHSQHVATPFLHPENYQGCGRESH